MFCRGYTQPVRSTAAGNTWALRRGVPQRILGSKTLGHALDAEGVFGLEIMVARKAETSEVVIAVCANGPKRIVTLNSNPVDAVNRTPEFIFCNPPVRKGTLYGTKQQHAA